MPPLLRYRLRDVLLTDAEETRKPGNWRERFFEACESPRKKRVAICSGFVFGLDTDTLEGLQETVRLACEAKSEFAQFSRLTPLPGTAQWNRFQNEVRTSDTDWSKFNLEHGFYQPQPMNADQLNRSIREAWFEF